MATSRRSREQPVPGSDRYSFCESSTSNGLWHIRPLDGAGLKLTGGITTPSLCGRVKPTSAEPDALGGWDIRASITLERLRQGQPFCRACRLEFIRAIKQPAPPLTVEFLDRLENYILGEMDDDAEGDRITEELYGPLLVAGMFEEIIKRARADLLRELHEKQESAKPGDK